jgi:hypothetical protein
MRRDLQFPPTFPVVGVMDVIQLSFAFALSAASLGFLLICDRLGRHR